MGFAGRQPQSRGGRKKEHFPTIIVANLGRPPGRLNVELASVANAILAYQKKPLTQVELHAALQAVTSTPHLLFLAYTLEKTKAAHCMIITTEK
jgi:hypothetical protein